MRAVVFYRAPRDKVCAKELVSICKPTAPTVEPAEQLVQTESNATKAFANCPVPPDKPCAAENVWICKILANIVEPAPKPAMLARYVGAVNVSHLVPKTHRRYAKDHASMPKPTTITVVVAAFNAWAVNNVQQEVVNAAQAPIVRAVA